MSQIDTYFGYFMDGMNFLIWLICRSLWPNSNKVIFTKSMEFYRLLIHYLKGLIPVLVKKNLLNYHDHGPAKV